MTRTAINDLCGLLKNAQQSNEASERKAKILSDFAVGVSDEILRRAGFGPQDHNREYNELAYYMDRELPEDAPADAFGELQLNDVPSSLTSTTPGLAGFSLLFGNERVMDWEDKTSKPRRVMTYEEAARFVVFWLAEKMIQIVRRNEWDRIKQLPDLFDRLAIFAISPSPLSAGAQLQEQLGLDYNPDTLLVDLGSTDFTICVRTYNALKSSPGYDRIGDIVQKSEADILGLPRSSRKVVNDLKENLSVWNLHLGMNLPPEVLAWYNSVK